jgi:large subunit ribosomal protein L30
MPAKLRITLKRSVIGNIQKHRDTVRTLGLKRINHTIEKEDSAVVRGMIHCVRHLVEVETVTEE